MGKIWSVSQDSAKYAAVAELVGIDATAVEIDASPLFASAENYIIGVYSKAVDRSDANRGIVDSALEFGAAAQILQGGGKLTGGITDAGAVKSVQIDDVRTEFATSTSTQAVKVALISELHSLLSSVTTCWHRFPQHRVEVMLVAHRLKVLTQ